MKQSSEMSFLYGNNVHKSGLGRITEGVPQHQGVVVLSMQSVPLGFGVTARSTEECRILDPSAVVVYHQADAGGNIFFLIFCFLHLSRIPQKRRNFVIDTINRREAIYPRSVFSEAVLGRRGESASRIVGDALFSACN